jgi:seryl-tRNA synthetase
MKNESPVPGARVASPEEVEASVNQRFARLYEIIGRKDEHIRLLQDAAASFRKRIDELDRELAQAREEDKAKLRDAGQQMVNIQAAHEKEKQTLLRQIADLTARVGNRGDEIVGTDGPVAAGQ